MADNPFIGQCPIEACSTTRYQKELRRSQVAAAVIEFADAPMEQLKGTISGPGWRLNSKVRGNLARPCAFAFKALASLVASNGCTGYRRWLTGVLVQPREHGSREQLFALRRSDCGEWCSAQACRRISPNQHPKQARWRQKRKILHSHR